MFPYGLFTVGTGIELTVLKCVMLRVSGIPKKPDPNGERRSGCELQKGYNHLLTLCSKRWFHYIIVLL